MNLIFILLITILFTLTKNLNQYFYICLSWYRHLEHELRQLA